jgi:hypothetical protein
MREPGDEPAFDLISALQREISRHSLDTFNEGTPDRPLITPGCPRCKKHLHTSDQLLDHISKDVVPAVVATWA